MGAWEGFHEGLAVGGVEGAVSVDPLGFHCGGEGGGVGVEGLEGVGQASAAGDEAVDGVLGRNLVGEEGVEGQFDGL